MWPQLMNRKPASRFASGAIAANLLPDAESVATHSLCDRARAKERPAMSGIAPASVSPHRGLPIVVFVAFLLTTVGSAIVVNPHSAFAANASTTSAVNLRTSANTTSRIKMVVPSGTTVRLYSTNPKNGFYKIEYQGVYGYIYGDYLSRGGSSSSGSSSGGGGGGGSVSSGGATGTARTTWTLNLRAEASKTDRVLLVMPSGASITLSGQSSNGFLKVTYQGTTGWASSSYIGSASQSGSSSGSGSTGAQDPGSGNAGSASTTSSLNLRSGPSTSSSVVLVMPSGASVTLTGNESNGFLGVNYSGTKGWASSSYLSTGGNTSGGNSGGGASGNYDSNGDGSWSQDEIIAIIYAAADYYGQPRVDMLRVARCESGLDPYNVTPPYSASGLFQFLPGTWASTPYASNDIFDPVASAFASGWMWANGRRGEWVCQ